MGHFLTLDACSVTIITYFYRILCLSPVSHPVVPWLHGIERAAQQQARRANFGIVGSR